MPKIDYTAIALDEQWRQRIKVEKQSANEWSGNWGMLSHSWVPPSEQDKQQAQAASEPPQSAASSKPNNLLEEIHAGSKKEAARQRALQIQEASRFVQPTEWTRDKSALKEKTPRERFDFPKTRAQEVGWNAGRVRNVELFGVSQHNHRHIPFE
eukprot:comp17394_c0_seq1/m.29312 comp17394_c0_seq1/g.29312  ORF comp17394_c0_seq1/g.29312 comp17394_c0_seq1/m.29312 type:complete len:154 (-) comp17394_c0_seq1:53-514(-)